MQLLNLIKWGKFLMVMNKKEHYFLNINIGTFIALAVPEIISEVMRLFR